MEGFSVLENGNLTLNWNYKKSEESSKSENFHCGHRRDNPQRLVGVVDRQGKSSGSTACENNSTNYEQSFHSINSFLNFYDYYSIILIICQALIIRNAVAMIKRIVISMAFQPSSFHSFGVINCQNIYFTSFLKQYNSFRDKKQ